MKILQSPGSSNSVHQHFSLMNNILKLACVILGFATWLPLSLQAASLSSFIDAGRRSKDVVLNSPRYDKKARVFFLCYLGYNVKDNLEAAVSPLVPVYDEIYQSGAEMILYLDSPPDQKENKKEKTRGKKSAQLIKCPIVNVFDSKTRDALFKKDARGKEHSYGTYELRAVDAQGVPLAYFNLDKGSIAMRDARTGEKKNIGSDSYSGNEWIGPAILASYKELVAGLSQTDASAAADEAEPKKKAKKKSGKKRKGSSKAKAD